MKNTMLAAIKNKVMLLVCVGVLAGCQPGKDGAPGPQGPAGAKGAPGAAGQEGEQMVKSGSIAGTVTGARADGTPINETIDFQYFPPSTESTFERNSDRIRLSIFRSDSSQNSSLWLSFEVNNDFTNPRFVVGIYYARKAGSNNGFALAAANFIYDGFNTSYVPAPVTGTFSNVAYNPNTGLLTGNFNWQVTNTFHSDSGIGANGVYQVNYQNYSGSSKPMQLTGTFSIPMKQRTFRVRAGQ
ncbi:MAG: hypothetical protein AVDCRST_MAG56-3956 [uncultured Cytophagales bacterium]|uniref:Collagen-like protein n=1 Tax=uncultured Cytophagales bacterium TaxID=158755 RepID=A0A6J4JPH3_9SPHI|nr:MAG: hypothetical protein AVDCRST_MAG56-3956 [uncultured Cytophagales bacterium]